MNDHDEIQRFWGRNPAICQILHQITEDIRREVDYDFSCPLSDVSRNAGVFGQAGVSHWKNGRRESAA